MTETPTPRTPGVEGEADGGRPLKTPGRARLVAYLRRLGTTYPPYCQLAQDVAEGRACEVPSWITLDLLVTPASDLSQVIKERDEAVRVLEPFSLLDGANMNDPLSKWLTIAQIVEVSAFLTTMEKRCG